MANGMSPSAPSPGSVMTIDKRAPRLAYLVTEDWYFLSHRLPMARAAKAAGYEVHVFTNLTGHAAPSPARDLRSIRCAGGAAA